MRAIWTIQVIWLTVLMPPTARQQPQRRTAQSWTCTLRACGVAFGIAAAFIVLLRHRVTRDLATREAELLRVRSAASRNEKLAALATLAAGAAHELATPLSTIAVAAKDLERSLPPAPLGAPSAMADDIRLIRSEVDRCRTILRQMSVEAGQSDGEGLVATGPEQLVALALEGLSQRARGGRVDR